MQSSFEGDTSFVIPPSSPNIPPPPPAPVSIPTGPMHGLTSIQEYNLQQLASLAEKVEITGDAGVVDPSSNPSPTPSFTLADLFAGDLNSTSHAINNLQALAKLGNSLGNQGNFFYNKIYQLRLVFFIIYHFTDLNPSTINGNNLVLGRGSSPVIVDGPNLATLTGSTLLNGGFQSLSSSTSPILSQGAGN
jgi:tripartite motif-containing protein 2/3